MKTSVLTKVFALVFGFLLLHPLAHGQTSCPTERLRKSQFTPEGIERWIQDNKDVIHSPKDFICCLPRESQDKYVIAHSSLAAQSGDANNPRLIYFEKAHHGIESPSFELQYAFSVNSGAEHLSNGDSVEFVFADQNSGELAYFDLNISEEFKGFEGGKNPDTCMACHGTNSRYGAKPIFTERPWHNFVGGTLFDPKFLPNGVRCEVMPLPLVKAIDLHAIDKLLVEMKNPDSNYNCVNQSTLQDARVKIETEQDSLLDIRFKIVGLDESLRVSHRHRIWRDLRNSEQWDQFKYLLVGQQVCDPIRLIEWIPRSQLKAFLERMDFYDGSYAELLKYFGNSNQLIEELDHFTNQAMLEEQEDYRKRMSDYSEVLESEERFQEFLAYSNGEIYFGNNPNACSAHEHPSIKVQKLNEHYSARQYLQRLIAHDNLLAQEAQNEGNDPILRLIFEGILGNTSHDMNMSLYPGVSSNSLNGKYFPVLWNEPASSKLFDVFEEVPLRWGGFSNDMVTQMGELRKSGIPFSEERLTWGTHNKNPKLFKSKFQQNVTCQKLKNLSRRAF